MTRTFLDTGPLVAFFDRKDGKHAWAYEQMGALHPPLFTCEPVLTEAAFLIQRGSGNPAVVLQALQQGTLRIGFTVETEAAALESLLRRYSDVPISLADACLVRLSELHQDCRVFTLDRHFARYRRHGRHVIPLLAPW